MTITHAKVSAKADGADTSLVLPSDWNAAHTVGSGTITEAMQVLADNTTGDLAITQHGYAPKAPNDTTKFLRGDATWAAPTASATLNGIAAATGAATIASGNNTGIIWNWANTTDSTVAFTFGETSAATGGTSTSGVPNQVLLKLKTLAASTQSPLSVYVRGNHLFSVAPTTRQLLFDSNGTNNAPTISTVGATNDGINLGGGSIDFVVGGTRTATITGSNVGTANGSATTPALSSIAQGNLGMFFTTNVVGFAVSGAENCRLVGSANAMQMIFQTCTFANLGTPANGAFAYCSDCDPGTAIDQTCASAGAKTGSFAARVNSAWKCFS